jgi:hypothetical protein
VSYWFPHSENDTIAKKFETCNSKGIMES